MKRFLPAVLSALVALVGGAGCSLKRGPHVEPLPLAATDALAEARILARLRPAAPEETDERAWLPRAEAAAMRAAAAAPEWLAPERVLDDLARERLSGHAALARRRAALEPVATAEELYLAGRLEGRAGIARLERAALLDPRLAWAQHGLAWNRFLAGEPRAALALGRRALALARGSYELGTFAAAEARYLLAGERSEEAIARLREHLDDPRLHEPERSELETWLARAELASDEDALVERGFWRGVALLERGTLTPDELDGLGELLLARRSAAGVPDPLSLLLDALARGGGANGDALRARILVERGAPGLAAALLEEGGALVPGPFQRARDLERGEAELAIERWRAALPHFLLDAEGLPREPALRELVLASRAVEAPDGPARFGAALLAAGWFDEAESWATALAETDRAAGLALAGRAASGQALLTTIAGLLARVDEDRAALVVPRAGEAPPAGREIEDLDELLAALEPAFSRHHGAELATHLVASPRLGFGAFASVVHPGPVFSALDEAEGRGTEGAPVPGLAAELARIGRFGIFGQAPGGGGPDGTVLRLAGYEWRAGAHLGVPFGGWVAWCEGADLESRPGRNGSSVSGAALHEGYWIDLERVREDWRRTVAFERAFADLDEPALDAALASRGPRVPSLLADGPERARWLAALGEGERVLLAVMRERERPADGGPRVPFGEMLALTGMHEEGHLTDRTRFLPLGRNLSGVLGFLVRHGFTPRAVARALEYRAQLVVLCEADEPRLALADCLSAADGEGGALPHGEAYRALVADLLEVAADELESLPALDPEHYLVHQLHFLSAEDVRRLARILADRLGMVAE